VRSSGDEAVQEVISAIDQLAADSRAGLTGADMRSRIAALWAMLAALDPELARLAAAYENTQARPTRPPAAKGARADAPPPEHARKPGALAVPRSARS
jgi:erythromycin esterase-like protein